MQRSKHRSKARPAAFPVEMPRYFFHVKRSGVTVFDTEGVVLANIAQAASEGARRARELAAEEIPSNSNLSAGSIIIVEEWRTVLELPL
jgi:uncharacterized protein DUF6894